MVQNIRGRSYCLFDILPSLWSWMVSLWSAYISGWLEWDAWMIVSLQSDGDVPSVGMAEIENDVSTQVTNCFISHKMVILVFISGVQSNEGNKHQNNTWVSTEAVRHESTYIIFFLTQHNETITYDNKNYLCTSSPCLTRSLSVLLMMSQLIADDITMTSQLWCDHMNSDI